MDLSVVISCSRPDKLLLCLEGFSKQKTTFDFEVIAVGDVYTRVEKYPFRCTLMPLDNMHVNARRNKGIDQAQAPRIALMDDDCVPEDNWVNEAVKGCNGNNTIVTGRELAYNENRFSQITHAILSSSLSEISAAHLNIKAEKLKWYEIVFCNCVIPKPLLDKYRLSETIPWDMDDFHFCYGVKGEALFYNNPMLVVQHDRYPDSYRKFVNYKWKLRVRTGEKIITHPEVYLKIPGVILSALFLPMLLLLLLAAIKTPAIIGAMVALYVLLIIGGSVYLCLRSYGLSGVVQAMIIFFTVHLLTAVAVQWGILRALVKR